MNREYRIRTYDPLVPNQVLYQTELIPVINGPNGNRTRDSAVTGQCDNLFTMRPNWMLFVGCRSITPTVDGR